MIGDAIKNALSIDVDKWTQKLNPMNWFKGDDPVASEQPDKWTQKINPMNWFKSDAPVASEQPKEGLLADTAGVADQGLQAERSTAGMLADNRSTTIDSHATVNITTNNPAVAQAAVEQAAPGSGSNYVDQSAQALS